MNDLFLSDESKEFQDLARNFYQNELAGLAEKLDHEGKFPMDLYKAAWELGLATNFIPEDFGGLGLSLWDCVVMAEEAAAASCGFAAAFEGNLLASAPLLRAGSVEQKEKYLTELTKDAALASYIFPDLSAGGDYPAPVAKVRRKGESFLLDCSEAVALNGSLASWYCLLAEDAEQPDSFSVFVFPANMSGIARGAQLDKLGRRCADLSYLSLENLELDKTHLIGNAGDGKAVMLESACISASYVAAHASGLMKAALEHSLAYSKERETFGKPISGHQAIAFMMADMAKNTQCARLMTWKAASLYDNDCIDHFAALAAKAFSLNAALSAATDAVQIFGGYGYSKEYPVERLMRDAKMMQMMAETSFDLNCFIGEELLISS